MMNDSWASVDSDLRYPDTIVRLRCHIHKHRDSANKLTLFDFKNAHGEAYSICACKIRTLISIFSNDHMACQRVNQTRGLPYRREKKGHRFIGWNCNCAMH